MEIYYPFLSVIAVVGYLFIGQTTVKKVSHWIYSFTVFAFAGIFMGIYNIVLQVPFTGYTKWDWTVFSFTCGRADSVTRH